MPIDGVGLQTHLDVQYPFPDRMQQNMQRFAELGLKVAVTEADVRIPLPVDATKQLAQNADYVQSLQACLAVRACISYTLWGFGDAYSWVPGVFAGEGAANIYDDNVAAQAVLLRPAADTESVHRCPASHRDRSAPTRALMSPSPASRQARRWRWTRPVLAHLHRRPAALRDGQVCRGGPVPVMVSF